MKKAFLSTVMLILMAAQGSAQAVRVEASSQSKIDAHGVCRNVINNAGTPTMVATQTPQEWSTGTDAFLNNIADIPNVRATRCLTPTAIYFTGNYIETYQGPKALSLSSVDDVTLAGPILPQKYVGMPAGYTIANNIISNPQGQGVPSCEPHSDSQRLSVTMFQNRGGNPVLNVYDNTIAPPFDSWRECAIKVNSSIDFGQRTWNFYGLVRF